MADREKVIKGLNCCCHTDGVNCIYCPYDIADSDCTALMSMDVLDLLKEQEAINFHNMGSQHAKKILTYAGIGCDVLSPDGFIHWLKQQMIKDPRFMDELKRRDDDA